MPASDKNTTQTKRNKRSKTESIFMDLQKDEEAASTEEQKQQVQTEEGQTDDDITSAEDGKEAISVEKELEGEMSSDNDQDSDSDDEAPEAVSTKSAKEDAISASKRAREIHLKTQADTKQRRRDADLKLKKQHEEKIARESRKQERVAKKQKKEEAKQQDQQKSSGEVPQLLSLDILEQLAEQEKTSSGKHVRLDEDSSEEEELSHEQKPKRQQDDKSRTVGSFRVVALNDLAQAAPPIATSIVSFREAHFYGGRVKRMDPILNISQRSSGAALYFARQESTKSKRRGMGIAEANPAPGKKKKANPIKH